MPDDIPEVQKIPVLYLRFNDGRILDCNSCFISWKLDLLKQVDDEHLTPHTLSVGKPAFNQEGNT